MALPALAAEWRDRRNADLHYRRLSRALKQPSLSFGSYAAFESGTSGKACEAAGQRPGTGSIGKWAQYPGAAARSEEHTSELQSHHDLVCRLLLEKKKKKITWRSDMEQ